MNIAFFHDVSIMQTKSTRLVTNCQQQDKMLYESFFQMSFTPCQFIDAEF